MNLLASLQVSESPQSAATTSPCNFLALRHLIGDDHVESQLLGDLRHILPVGWPSPPVDISQLLRRSLRLDSSTVQIQRSIPPGPSGSRGGREAEASTFAAEGPACILNRERIHPESFF